MTRIFPHSYDAYQRKVTFLDGRVLVEVDVGRLMVSVVHLYYTLKMAVDWSASERAEYIVAKHGVTPEQANEALDDPNAVVFRPDYNSKSGQSVRTVGYSPGAESIITVITVEDKGVVYGASAWKSNARDRRYYEGAE